MAVSIPKILCAIWLTTASAALAPSRCLAENDSDWSRAMQAGNRFHELGQHEESENKYREALTIAEGFQAHDRRLAATLSRLGVVCGMLSKICRGRSAGSQGDRYSGASGRSRSSGFGGRPQQPCHGLLPPRPQSARSGVGLSPGFGYSREGCWKGTSSGSTVPQQPGRTS